MRRKMNWRITCYLVHWTAAGDEGDEDMGKGSSVVRGGCHSPLLWSVVRTINLQA